MKKSRVIFSILLLLLCLSFSGCTDRQQDDVSDNSSSQDTPQDIVIPGDKASGNSTDDTTVDGYAADSDDSENDGDGVIIDDSGELPNTDVEFAE